MFVFVGDACAKYSSRYLVNMRITIYYKHICSPWYSTLSCVYYSAMYYAYICSGPHRVERLPATRIACTSNSNEQLLFVSIHQTTERAPRPDRIHVCLLSEPPNEHPHTTHHWPPPPTDDTSEPKIAMLHVAVVVADVNYMYICTMYARDAAARCRPCLSSTICVAIC